MAREINGGGGGAKCRAKTDGFEAEGVVKQQVRPSTACMRNHSARNQITVKCSATKSDRSHARHDRSAHVKVCLTKDNFRNEDRDLRSVRARMRENPIAQRVRVRHPTLQSRALRTLRRPHDEFTKKKKDS
jgi:hypothetical protein